MSMSWEVFRRSLLSRRTARRFDNAVDDGDAARPTTSGTPLVFESLEPRLLLAADPLLTAAYAFNETSGTTTVDATGHGLTGTLTSGPVFAAGKNGNGIRLDGVNDYVNLGNPTALRLTGSMTISAWINSSAFPGDDAAIVSKRTGGEVGFQLDTTVDTGARRIGFKLTNSAGGQMFRYGATTLQANTWYYVTGVYDAAAQTLHVYLNGQLDDGVLQGTVTAAQQNSTANVNIGRRPGSPGTFNFIGTVDDVRIYSRALTQAEIQTDMLTPVTPATADTTPPTVPTGLAATAVSSTQINLSWTASTDNVGVTGYQMFRDGVQIATVATTTYTDSGRTPSTTYQYTVRATDAASNLSALTAAVPATTPAAADTTPPTVPTGLAATAVSSTQINLSWTASTDNVGVTGYQVFRDGVQIATVTTTDLCRQRPHAQHHLSVHGARHRCGQQPVGADRHSPGDHAGGGRHHAANGADRTCRDGDLVDPDHPVLDRLDRQRRRHRLPDFPRRRADCDRHHHDLCRQRPHARHHLSVHDTRHRCGQQPVGADCPGPGDHAGGGCRCPDRLAHLTGQWCVSLRHDHCRCQCHRQCRRCWRPVSAQRRRAGRRGSTSAYSVSWDTTTAANGNYTLTARARDAAGNITTSTPITVTVSNTQVVAGPEAAYALNETSGPTTADATGHGLTGTLTNGPVFAAGKYGNGVRLDGVNDFVNLGNPTALQITGSMTISAWINSSAFPGDDAAIVSKRDGNGFQLDTTVDTGARRIGFKLTSSSGGDMFRYGATTLQANTWYYVTGVYDAVARTLHVYLNGQLDDGVLQGTVTATQQNSTANVSIGQRTGFPGTFNFIGTVDDVRIYSRALTQAQIQADMLTPVGGGTGDTTPPTVPTGLAATAVSSTQINLSWTASTDNVGVTGYQVFRDGVQIATVTTTTYADSGRTPDTTYQYTVRATDAANNLSALTATGPGDHAGGGRHHAANGADRTCHDGDLVDPDHPVLDRLDRQRRRHRLPDIPRRRADCDRHHHDLCRQRPHARHHLSVHDTRHRCGQQPVGADRLGPGRPRRRRMPLPRPSRSPHRPMVRQSPALSLSLPMPPTTSALLASSFCSTASRWAPRILPRPTA